MSYTYGMRRMGRPSWQIRLDTPQDLHLLLFVRDAFTALLGLPSAGAPDPGAPGPGTPQPIMPGRLEDDVPDLSERVGDLDHADAARSWSMWWRDGLDRHRAAAHSPPPSGAPLEEHARWARRRHAAVDAPGFASLAGTPALQTAARASFQPFLQWWSPPLPHEPVTHAPDDVPDESGVQGHLIGLTHPRHRNPVEQQVVTRVEREIGRTAAPFDLSIDLLALEGPGVLEQDERYAVISTTLFEDVAAYTDWLHTTLRPLA